MHKKIALVSLALLMVFVMVGAAAAATAPKAMTNTNQKGSLLIWPKIIVGYDAPDWADTIIFLSNDNSQQIWVQCYWMDENQTVEDFNFKLTPNQPIVFSSGFGMNIPVFDPVVTVPPFFGSTSPYAVGALYCWAVKDDDSTAIPYNHLYGNALIISGEGDSIKGTVVYNAYSFVQYAAAAAPAADGTQVLDLDGKVYDACPSYLLMNFTPAGEFINPDVETSLTLVPCKQDLTQDRKPTYTKAKFDIWNANETKFTGAWQCLKCFAEFQLDDVGQGYMGKSVGYTFNKWTGRKVGKGFGGDKFTPFVLKTWADRMRITGIPSTVCDLQPTVYTGFVGLVLYEDMFPGYAYAGTTLHGAGLANLDRDKGFVKWDTGVASQEGAGR